MRYATLVLCRQSIPMNWLMWKAWMIQEQSLELNITTRPAHHSLKAGRIFNPLEYCTCITFQNFRDAVTGTNTCIDLTDSYHTMSLASIKDWKIESSFDFAWSPSASLMGSTNLWQVFMAISWIFSVTQHANRNYCKPPDWHADLGQIFQRISGSHDVIGTSILEILIFFCCINVKMFSLVPNSYCSQLSMTSLVTEDCMLIS